MSFASLKKVTRRCLNELLRSLKNTACFAVENHKDQRINERIALGSSP
ncbi:hypothetical protein Pla100_47700 [Neorhodopirellula pilleata]|uniref:Uncharacterized protein n=1 Tax=Neorhodopirellula pilleata TaxID=2714738 RepID=A0A5C6A110_9BACT|nr:hypothetical protein Pla100_47700 [Neorhodopirellula pilleata]